MKEGYRHVAGFDFARVVGTRFMRAGQVSKQPKQVAASRVWRWGEPGGGRKEPLVRVRVYVCVEHDPHIQAGKHGARGAKQVRG